MPSLQTFAKGTFATAVGLSTFTAGLLYYGQNYLIYPAAIPPGSRSDVPTPDKFGLAYEDLTLETIDGIKIKCFLMLQRKEFETSSASTSSSLGKTNEEYLASRPTVIMFHGNGGNLGHRIPLAGQFYLHMGCNVLMLSYRGYGHSKGSPSEKGACSECIMSHILTVKPGLRIDAQTALDYITSHSVLGKSDRNPSGSKIILYGQSLGGAVALDLAVRNSHCITGIILENTFLSIPRMIPSAVPFLSPLTFLCHQKWDSATAITKLPANIALLMLSGRRDEVVPPSHMSELWEISKNVVRDDATWKSFPSGMHNSTWMLPSYWETITDFVRRVGG